MSHLELLSPASSLRHILEELHGRVAVPQYARPRGVHLCQIVEGQDVAILGGHGEVLGGHLVVLPHADAREVHDPQLEVREYS